MASSAAPASQQGAVRDHGFHPLRVRRVVRETAEAASFVLEVPADRRNHFAYEAGQFLTFRALVDGEVHHRCYSMSSSPEVDDELQVTVKRVPGGVVSNWMLDTVAPGDLVEASLPAGVFRLGATGGDLVAFAAGSGITPVFSLLKSALAATDRRVRLYYANRDRDAAIFRADLDALADRHRGRVEVVHHLDAERGFVDASAVHRFVADATAAASASATDHAEYYVCGPAPFMDVVEGALRARGVGAARIHVERFTPAEPPPAPEPTAVDGGDGSGDAGGDGPTATRVTIELGGRRDTVDHRPGTTILQTARQMGMSPPFSCESGTCATCMAMLVEGSVRMRANDALTDDEVEEGWVLTCQSEPTSPSVRVVYEGS